MYMKTEEGFDLKVRSRNSNPVTINIPADTLVLQRDFILQRDFGHYNETLRLRGFEGWSSLERVRLR